MWRTDSLERPWFGKDWRREEKETTEDQMVGWHHWLNGHAFEHAPGVGDGQGSLACCSLWDLQELNTTEQLNWTDPMPQSNHFVHNELRILSTTQALSCQRKLVPFSLILMLFFFFSFHGGLVFLSKENVCHPRASLFYTSNVLGFSSKHLYIFTRMHTV